VSKIERAVRLILLRPRRAWLLARIAVATIKLSGVLRFRPLPSALGMFSVATNDDGRELAPRDAEVVTAVDAVLGMDLLMFRAVCWKHSHTSRNRSRVTLAPVLLVKVLLPRGNRILRIGNGL
jgi:hypothetical protein